MKLSLGSLLFYWQRDKVYDFYRHMVEQPLDVIYLGESVCSKRRELKTQEWIELGKELAAAGKEVDAELHTAAGLIDVVGVGEAPVGRLATFSLWESAKAVRTYAYAMPRHQQVIEQTRDGDWYAEELFARFEPYGSTGTWNGRNPLAD